MSSALTSVWQNLGVIGVGMAGTCFTHFASVSFFAFTSFFLGVFFKWHISLTMQMKAW
jgi:hypothetical protein